MDATENYALALEYHTILFAYMGDSISENFNAKRNKRTKEIVSFYTTTFSHLSGTKKQNAISFIKMVQDRLEEELKNIISKKSIYYWFHLYRRIAPVASFNDESIQTVWLYRNILETAFNKYGNNHCGSEILYSEERPINIEEISSGIYAEAIKHFGIQISELNGIFLGKFGQKDLLEIYELERIAYEYWHTTVCARRIYKGGVLYIKRGNYYVENDDSTERLMKFFDTRGEDMHSTDGIILTPEKYSNGTTFVPKYNVEQFKLSECPNHKIFSLNIMPELESEIMNFIWLPFDFDYYYITHKFYQEEFKKRYGYSIEAFTYVLYLICVREIYLCSASTYSAGMDLLKRAYRFIGKIETLIDDIFEISKTNKLPSIKNYNLGKKEINFVLSDMQTKNDISLVTMGPRPLIIPSVSNGYNIDYAAIYFILITKTQKLYPKEDKKGHLFEDVVISRLKSENIELWECQKKLKHSDGSSKEVDVSFIYKDFLFIGELKANSRSIVYIEGSTDILNFRKTKMQQAIDQAEQKSNWLLCHKTGTNYRIPQNIKIIVPFVVTPFNEYIWSEEEKLWITEKIPRICTPEECCNLCTDEVIRKLSLKPYVRYLR